MVGGIRSSLQTLTPKGDISAVYYSPDKDYLDLRGLVSVAEDPRAGKTCALGKVGSGRSCASSARLSACEPAQAGGTRPSMGSAVYRLQVVE